MSSRKIRVLLADDHTIVRRGLRMLLDSQADIEVIGEAKTGREAIDVARAVRPDVVVMDVSMPELNGIESTRQICDELLHTRVIAVSCGTSGLQQLVVVFAAGNSGATSRSESMRSRFLISDSTSS